MNKDFTQKKLLSFSENKQIKILHDLTTFIEQNEKDVSSNSFIKLSKYHHFLKDSSNDKIQKLNKEFFKIKAIDYQFQIYLMNLERLLGQSTKEYDFLIKTQDSSKKEQSPFPIICLLDSIRSAHNVGAMFRNAECFNIEKILLTGLSPRADHPQVVKTAMKTQEKVNWDYQKDPLSTVNELKKQGHEIWAIETVKESLSINQINNRPNKLVLIFGHEQFGISLELLKLCDKIIKIELFGDKNSLNVSTSQAIVLHHLVQFN